MRRAGIVVWLAHQRVAQMVGPGVSTAEINQAVRQTFLDYQATPLFLNYPPGGARPFPAETCVSVNEQVVHGIPGARRLKAGDIVSVDTGCRIDGWCGDAAVTHAIGKIDPATETLLARTRAMLDTAIEALKTAERWSDVTPVMQAIALESGLGIVETMVGHGIGTQLHEAPEVPNYFDPAWKNDFRVRPGLVIAVEPMVNLGTKEVRTGKDGWTIVTADRRYSAHFEHTIALTQDGPVRLTAAPTAVELSEIGRPDWLADPAQWYRW